MRQWLRSAAEKTLPRAEKQTVSMPLIVLPRYASKRRFFTHE